MKTHHKGKYYKSTTDALSDPNNIKRQIKWPLLEPNGIEKKSLISKKCSYLDLESVFGPLGRWDGLLKKTSHFLLNMLLHTIHHSGLFWI